MKRISFSVPVCLFAAMLAAQGVAAQQQASPAETAFRQEGIASWYGSEFDGRPTASGEIFNSALFTAAHPTLPFGTFLIVTNRNNNRQVSVRVNDRGPFTGGRIIDVSRAAAEHLGMVVSGTAPVLIEAVPSQVVRQELQEQELQTAFAPPLQIIEQIPIQPAPQQQPIQTEPAAQAEPQRQPQVVHTTESARNVPITVNIFHVPGDSVQQPIVVVKQAQAQEQMPPQAESAAAGEEWALPPPVTPTPQAVPASPIPAQPQMPAWPSPQSPPAVQIPPERSVPTFSVNPNSTYRMQVGSFRVARNAVDTFVRIRDAGLQPSYERSGDFFRVVLAGVGGANVQSTAEKLAELGFHDAIITEE